GRDPAEHLLPVALAMEDRLSRRPRLKMAEDDHPQGEEESPEEAQGPGAQVIPLSYPRHEGRVEGERGEEREGEAAARQKAQEGEEGGQGEEPAHRAPPAGPRWTSSTWVPGSTERA